MGLDTIGEETINAIQQQQEMVYQNCNVCAILIKAFTENKSLSSIIQQTISSLWPSRRKSIGINGIQAKRLATRPNPS